MIDIDAWNDEKTPSITDASTGVTHSVDGTGKYFLFGSSNPKENKKRTEYLAHLTSDKFTVPSNATHLSFYLATPHFSFKAKSGLNIIMDGTVIMRIDGGNALAFGPGYELVDVDIRKYADDKGHDLRLHYITEYVSSAEVLPTLLVDKVHLMACSDSSYVNTAKTAPQSSAIGRCSQWCALGANTNNECNEECNTVECGFDFGMCGTDGPAQMFDQKDPDDDNIANPNGDNGNTKKIVGYVLIVVGAVALVAFVVGFGVLVYNTRESIIVKRGKADNDDEYANDRTLSCYGKSGNSELWSVDKKLLTFGLGGREADIGIEYSEDIVITNKRLDFNVCTFTVVVPEDKKYEITTNAKKFQIGKVTQTRSLSCIHKLFMCMFIFFREK